MINHLKGRNFEGLEPEQLISLSKKANIYMILLRVIPPHDCCCQYAEELPRSLEERIEYRFHRSSLPYQQPTPSDDTSVINLRRRSYAKFGGKVSRPPGGQLKHTHACTHNAALTNLRLKPRNRLWPTLAQELQIKLLQLHGILTTGRPYIPPS